MLVIQSCSAVDDEQLHLLQSCVTCRVRMSITHIRLPGLLPVRSCRGNKTARKLLTLLSWLSFCAARCALVFKARVPARADFPRVLFRDTAQDTDTNDAFMRALISHGLVLNRERGPCQSTGDAHAVWHAGLSKRRTLIAAPHVTLDNRLSFLGAAARSLCAGRC